jgi:2-oxoglutarate dehydrogenase E2 component (dihydrolipoamide succinyltransferase)
MSIVEMKVPAIGESITEVTLSQWLKEDGSYVELDEPICEFDSDKATLEFPAEAAGKLMHVAKEGEDLEIGGLVAKIDTSVEQSAESKSDDNGEAKDPGPAETGDKAAEEKTKEEEKAMEEKQDRSKSDIASPAASKMLRENDLRPQDIEGTGKDGRITKQDVLKALEEKEQQESDEPMGDGKPGTDDSSQPERQLSKQEFSRKSRREKMSRMRRTIAKRLVSAKNTTAMLTTFNEIDLSKVIELRKKYQDQFVEKYGIKLGFMSLFAKACSQILLEMPEVNAQLDDDHLIYHDYTDIAIAISTPSGLVVPPIRNVESLQFHEIEYKVKELAEKARDGKLSLDEMSGGTFTITNGGIFGSLMSTPILNEPQSAILGMHAIQERPVAIDGEVEVRPMMYVALSYDHRVIDGSSSVTFLVKVKRLLEDPMNLLLSI